MSYNFKLARNALNIEINEAASALNVSPSALTDIEEGKTMPGIDVLLKAATLYRTSADFLLGRYTPLSENELPVECLPLFHGIPVFSKERGFLLTDASESCLITAKGESIPFSAAEKLYFRADTFYETLPPQKRPLTREELAVGDTVWVEPVSHDADLKAELRGRYRIKHHAIENECGNRFTLDSYGAKWLAFSL